MQSFTPDCVNYYGIVWCEIFITQLFVVELECQMTQISYNLHQLTLVDSVIGYSYINLKCAGSKSFH